MNSKGYTFLELAVTLAIASLMTVLAVHYSAAPSPRRALHAAGQTLIQQLRLARQKAIADGQDSVVEFSPISPAFNQYQHPVLGAQTLPKNVKFGGPNGAKECKKDGVSFNNNKARFEPNGTIASEGTICLISTTSTDTLKITVSAAGRIAESPYNNELE